MVTGGSSLHQAYKLFGGTQSFGLSAWIVVFAATELLSCQVNPTGSMPKQRFVSRDRTVGWGCCFVPLLLPAPPPPFPTRHHYPIPALYLCSTCLQVIHIKVSSLLCPLHILQACDCNLCPDHTCMLVQLPNFNALFLVSLLAAFMSISYSTIGWVSAVAEGKAAAVSYAILGGTTPKIMGIFNGLGTMVFAYGGHSVVLEIQVTLELQDLDDWLACMSRLRSSMRRP